MSLSELLTFLLTLAGLLAMCGIALEEMASWEDRFSSGIEALVLAALRAIVTFQVYACGSWVVVKALSGIACRLG